jgi:hypothetical protein
MATPAKLTLRVALRWLSRPRHFVPILILCVAAGYTAWSTGMDSIFYFTIAGVLLVLVAKLWRP